MDWHATSDSRWVRALLGGLLNSQPMGFCVPAQPVRDAKHHGVAPRLVDVPSGNWRTTLEEA